MPPVSQRPVSQRSKIQSVSTDTKTEARLPITPDATFDFDTYPSLQAISRTDPRVAEAREMLRDANSDSLIEQTVAITRRHFASGDACYRDFGTPNWQNVGTSIAANKGSTANKSFAANKSMWRVLLYAPLYVWNQCVNQCKYCGFNSTLDIDRESLDEGRAIEESNVLTGWGIRHQLLVAGEFPRFEKEGRLEKIATRLTEKGVIPSVEVAPRSVDGYRRLVDSGVSGVTLFQETYDKSRYNDYHPQGPKSVYDWRLEGLDRAATAGIRRLGLGALLGLADPKEELAAMVAHGLHLQQRYPDAQLAFNLPRLHASPGEFEPPFSVDDETFLQFYCILRVTFPTAEMVLSTREQPTLRNRLAKICITQMSAASSTAPGGYAERSGDEQFTISDSRSVAEVVTWLETEGFSPISATCGQ